MKHQPDNSPAQMNALRRSALSPGWAFVVPGFVPLGMGAPDARESGSLFNGLNVGSKLWRTAVAGENTPRTNQGFREGSPGAYTGDQFG